MPWVAASALRWLIGAAAGVQCPRIEKHPDGPHRRAVLGVAAPADAGLAVGGVIQAHHGAHGGGLPGAVGAQEAGHAAGSYVEGQVVDSGRVAVHLGQAADLDHDLPLGGWLG